MKTSKETIQSIVWKACDTFRGSIDAALYKDYILSMLFVKYLSDFVKEKTKELEEKYKDDKSRIQMHLEMMKYHIDKEASFDYLVSKKEESNIGEIINRALHRIEEKNPDKFSNIFGNIDFNDSNKFGAAKDKNAILKNLLEDFDDKNLDLSPSALENNDVMGDAYEYLIKNFAGSSGKKGGEYYTPPEVSILIAKLVSHNISRARVYDPTCGSGSLLIKVYKEIGKKCSIHGQEKNSQTYSLCRMNMYLHEIGESAKIKWADTLKSPEFIINDKLEKFDIVVANPPFSLDKWGYEDIANNDKYNRFEYGIPPKGKGDYAFLLHMINSMADNGTLAVVMPHCVLFRGASEGIIRERIIKENLIHAIIGLPANLFFGTSIPACILILKKNREEKDILFINASDEYEKGKNQNRLRDEDIDKILNAYKERKDIEKYSKVVSFEEIKNNEYNLNIPRYIDSFEDEESRDLKDIISEIKLLEKEREEINKKLEIVFKEIDLL